MAPHLLSFQADHSGGGLGWEPPTCRFPNYPKSRWSHHHYLTYLTTYLDRKLTYDDDILNAFAGIITDAKEGGMTKCFGLTKDHFGLEMLWKHSPWATRRSGFPSWTWAGWKGCIVHHDRGKYSSEEEWIHSNSWIHWYVYDEKDGGFSILASGHRPESEKVVGKEENRMAESNNLQNEMRQESTISGTSDAKVSNSGGGNKLVALLARLSLNGADEATSTRPIPFPNYCIPTLDRSTLLFLNLGAYLSVAALKPDGHKPCTTRQDFSTLPPTPNLYLYTKRGTHVGTAWVSAADMYNKILINDKQGNDRFTIEVAVLSGPTMGDWRTRNEKTTIWQYMQELAKSGMYLGDLMSRYKTRLEYEKLIASIYIRMLNDWGGVSTDGSVHVPPTFWDHLIIQSSLGYNTSRG